MTVEFVGRSARVTLEHARASGTTQSLVPIVEVVLRTEHPTLDPDESATATV
jgi:hypothetical protein